MAFYSLAFLGFILIAILLHEAVGRIKGEYQWIVRLLASVGFFTYISGFRIIFLLLSVITIWAASNCSRLWTGKTVLYITVGINLVLLITAKYLFPISGHPIILPLGISFYTLMAISYLVDIYGKKHEPEKCLGKLMLYLCWFPQLIQGPISRYENISKTLYRPFLLSAPAFRYAFYLFFFGAIKKYAIGDLLAPMVSASLDVNSVSQMPGSYLLFGAFLFAVEQYANFSGGIEMAVGVSLLFGVNVDKNFNQPYFATSLADFWRRWHMTLGSFMRDYVFYPFALLEPVRKFTKKNSKRLSKHLGRAITGGIGNILVFSLVGLWHGPQLHYLAWGLYNGFIIALSDLLVPWFDKIKALLHIKSSSRIYKAFCVIRTFMIIVFAGYFDVIDSVRAGLCCFKRTILDFSLLEGLTRISELYTENVVSLQSIIIIAISIILLLFISIRREKGFMPFRSLSTKPFLLRWLFFFSFATILLYSFTVSKGIGGFMYAAF